MMAFIHMQCLMIKIRYPDHDSVMKKIVATLNVVKVYPSQGEEIYSSLFPNEPWLLHSWAVVCPNISNEM